ncbi:histidine kinase [Pseudonocardia sp. GCM10023141]|uniref:histidine kinase n=1 Tax=Pseudonocardia sp. GCM10023141 TaxID=3252653 RepID=UPI0036142240
MPTAQRPSWWGGVLPTVILPLGVAAILAGGTGFARLHQTGARPLDLLAVVLVAIGPIVLVVRRRHPPATLAVAVLALIAYLAFGYPFGPIFVASLVALFSAIAAGHRVAAYSIAGVGLAALAIVFLVRYPGDEAALTGLALWLSVLTALSLAAEGWRMRGERVAQARAARAEIERRRGSEERLRIAQELHDVLGHHVSLINVQAGVALYLMDDDPEQARTALTAIKQSSKDLLREMRATLGVLRGVDEAPPHHPVPGLGRLDALVADTRAAGLPVEVEVVGASRELPPSVDLAAYRIVQEALTNTRRHAGPARAEVRVTYDESELTVQVDDTGSGSSDGGSVVQGNGIPGMRERARALGGSLTAGPHPDGGYRVLAHLPVSPIGWSS